MDALVTIGHLVFAKGAADAHGNPVQSWANPVDLKVYTVYPRTSTETVPGRDVVYEGLTVLAPSGTDFGPHDRVLWNGDVYEVEGDLGDWTNGPFEWDAGISLNLKRVEG